MVVHCFLCLRSGRYGSSAVEVDLLSPYEMLMHWSMEKLKPPAAQRPREGENAIFTEEGLAYQKACKGSAKQARVPGGPDFHISYRSVSVGSSSASEVSCTHSQPVNRIFFMFYPETSYVCMLAHRNCGRAVRASLPPAQGASFKDTFCSNFKAFVRTSEVVGGGGGGGGGDLSSEDRMRHRAIASPAPLSPTQDI
jgi:hypothetical protein